ncbi:MAG: cupredoxin domain-containing protein [Gammaproteobacteria bacterium]|nr:cupredoxin domain-containing protein [Gammaproteobacteria bacterium]
MLSSKEGKAMKWRSLLLIFIISLSSYTAVAADESPLVIIKKFKFIPQEITIKRGQTLRWENHEKRQYHSVWFKALGEEEPDDYLFPDDSYERKFEESGSFPYRCGPHEEMTGIVHVTD